MNFLNLRRWSWTLVILGLAASNARAQTTDTFTAEGRVQPLHRIGSTADQRLRVDHLLGAAGTGGYLIRTSSTLTPFATDTTGFVWSVISPELRAAWNSALPFSRNDGALWAGRGANVEVSGGFRLAIDQLSLTIAPQLTYSQNSEFDLLAPDLYPEPRHPSAFASPWYTSPGSIDQPLRLGDRPLTFIDPGQSRIEYRTSTLAVGAATENQWWGPGIHNAIVMSNHAPGFPHLYVGTGEPVWAYLGEVEAKLFTGGLTESLYFDADPSNDLRALSALVVTLTPAGEPNLTIGGARAVYSPASGPADVLAKTAKVFTSWERRPLDGDTTWAPASEQITSIFGRWVFPAEGAEVYGEWARVELPSSLRDMFTAPEHTQGYTLGFQLARKTTPGVFLINGEATYLEQSATFLQRPTATFYTSRSIPQGYTHRGRTVGASIGPGSSSQWISTDFLGDTWQFGLYGGRIRWETDGFYRTPTPDPARVNRSFHGYDVSMYGGVRGGLQLPWVQLDLSYGMERRYNYLFQNLDVGFTPADGVNVRNRHFRLTARPRL